MTAHLAEPQMAAELRSRAVAAARAAAGRLWQEFERLPDAKRWLVAGRSRRFKSWAFAERLCEESARSAADSAPRALELARLALRVAERCAGGQAWRLRLRGYATAFLANALRVGGRVRDAESEMQAAWALWNEGAATAGAALLAEWRLFDLEASLRREQRQFAVTLELLDRALASAPPEAAGRILLNRAWTLELLGDIPAALADLQQAAPLVERSGDPRQRWILAFHLARNLCHCGRYEDAAAALPSLRQQSVALANELDLLRVLWLSGRVADGLGRTAEAIGTLEHVRDEFLRRRFPSDTAQASLELAVLYLREGRVAEVRELAESMAWVFTGEGIRLEALASLRLFYEAACRETVTLDEARQALEVLRQSLPPLPRARP